MNLTNLPTIYHLCFNQSPTLGTVLRIQSFTAVVESTLAIFYHWSLSVEGMVEFDPWIGFDPWHFLLIHTSIWHTSPSQLVVREVLI